MMETGPTGEVVEIRVRRALIAHSFEIFTVDVGLEALRCTGDHPFWVNGKGWTAVRKIGVGDELATASVNTLRVENIRSERLTSPVIVVLLTVDEPHNYFVGMSGILVHNKQ
jgi:intein/homing endonuclease